MEITSTIFLVGGSGLSHSSDAAVYLIKNGPRSVLIDAATGKASERIISNMAKYGVRPEEISHIFITHCHYDHTGGINRLREMTGARVISHHLTAEFLEAGDSRVTAAMWYGAFMEPTPVDETVERSPAEFHLDDMTLTFYHTPGHSPGSSVMTVVSDEKLVLFGQDVHGPLNDELRSSRSEYVESLRFLLSLEADILCEGHFGVFRGKEKVKKFIESFL